jgi:hypothetical protein
MSKQRGFAESGHHARFAALAPVLEAALQASLTRNQMCD